MVGVDRGFSVREEAAFSGDDARYTSLPLDATLNDRPLTWHLLTRR